MKGQIVGWSKAALFAAPWVLLALMPIGALVMCALGLS